MTVFAALATFALLKYPRWARRAGYGRACRLGQAAGLSPEGQKSLDHLYGLGDEVRDPFA